MVCIGRKTKITKVIIAANKIIEISQGVNQSSKLSTSNLLDARQYTNGQVTIGCSFAFDWLGG